MKLLFVLPRMVCGGVERATLRLVEGLQARGHKCAFGLRRSYGEFLPEAKALCPVYEVAAGGLHQFVPKLAQLIRVWQPSHIITAFADVGVLTYLAIKQSGLKPKWVHGVHGPHDAVTANPGLKGQLRYQMDQYLSAWVYKKSDKVVAVSHGVRADILQRFKVESGKVVTIHNPVLDETQLIPRGSKSGFSKPPKIVALGRLTREKGFDVLIEAMCQVSKPWQLEIWGDGEDKAVLQSQIFARGLQEHIRLCGHSSQPLEILRQADVFVLSSRYEGFGLVLVEALACGCRIVASDCLHGPREILENGRYGLLVDKENAASLAQGISSAIVSREALDIDAMQRRASDFLAEKSVMAWEEFINA